MKLKHSVFSVLPFRFTSNLIFTLMLSMIFNLFFNLNSHASTSTGLKLELTQELLDTLVPQGFSLVQEYIYLKDPNLNKLNLINNSSVVFDFNKDGFEDIALIVEKTVCYLLNAAGNCVDIYYFGAESRKLLFYFGQKNNKFKLFLETKNGILNYGDSGDESKDPLYGFNIDENGVISISYQGGSELTWSYELEIQFKDENIKPDFYIISVLTIWQDYVTNPLLVNNDYMTSYIVRDFEAGSIEKISFVTSDILPEQYTEETKSLLNPILTPLRHATVDQLFAMGQSVEI